jgi:hypothetical protein
VRQISLPTGELEIRLTQGEHELDTLLGFAARANAKRGFLFLSKVLGKHWPVKPSLMQAIHARMAANVPASSGPVVFIAMAETAIGLGQGVFEAWLKAHPDRDALFIHTSRYRVGSTPIIEFEEAHSHAPRQFLHMPQDAAQRLLLETAGTLVLVDDEASTGNTFLNLSNACRRINPHLSQVHLSTIINFMGEQATEQLSARFGLPVTLGALVSGEYRFEAGTSVATPLPAQLFDPSADRGASTAFGRLGINRPLAPAPVDDVAASLKPGASVLVLGTGEFMHAPALLAASLEHRGFEVAVQSTTRSPVLVWGAVASALAFPDNYGEGVGNFLYNVTPGQYDHVLICHETAPNAALLHLARLLDGRLLHFVNDALIEIHVSEIPVC